MAESVRVTVAGLALDQKSSAPIVVLKEVDGERVLPIMIGFMEATAIAAKLEGLEFPRPMTHDLLLNVIESVGGKLEKIEVVDLRDSTYYATLYIRVGDKVLEIDARPSDSIALALRAGAQMFVSEHVFSKAGITAPEKPEDAWEQLLESLDDEDFGKYKV